MRLTLTEDGCTYEGPETQATGSFTAEVENESSTYGAFKIGELAEGSSSPASTTTCRPGGAMSPRSSSSPGSV